MAITYSRSQELYDPLADTPKDELYEIYATLRREQPVFHNETRDVWCISRFDDVLAVARDWNSLSSAAGVDLDVDEPLIGPGDFIGTDPPVHDVLRAVAKERFIPRNLKDHAPIIERRVTELLDGLAGCEEVDLASEFAWALPGWVICQILGLPESDYPYVKKQLVTVTERDPGSSKPSDDALEALRELKEFFIECADFKRKVPGDDMLTDLSRAVDRGELSSIELSGMCMTLFDACTETTSSLLGNGLWLLDRHGDQQGCCGRARWTWTRAGIVSLPCRIVPIVP